MRRRELLQEKVLPKLREPIRFSPELHAPLSDLIRSVKEQGLEGLVAKRRESIYEPGLQPRRVRNARLFRAAAIPRSVVLGHLNGRANQRYPGGCDGHVANCAFIGLGFQYL